MKIKHLLLRSKAWCLSFMLVAIFAAFSKTSQSQTRLSLQQCYQQIDSLFPLVSQKEKLASIQTLNDAILKAGYYPSIDLNAKISYQSKVTEVPVLIPGVSGPQVPHEQYGATVDINQLVYDGGLIKASKQIAKQKEGVDLLKVDIDIYQVKEQVNQWYFVCLALQEQQSIIKLMQEVLQERKVVLTAAVENGLVNVSELDNLSVECMVLDQQLIEITAQKQLAFNALSILSGLTFKKEPILEIPAIVLDWEVKTFRPEHKLFIEQAALLDANIDLKSVQRMPKVVAFGSGGMGYPGLNMFSDAMDPYFIVGAQVNWKIWDWKKTKNEKSQLLLQKEMLDDNLAIYDKNLGIKLSKEQLAIDKLNALIEKDEQIIEMRSKITKRSASQLQNGTKTSADFISDMNAEKQARINLTSNQIKLVQAKLNFMSLKGIQL